MGALDWDAEIEDDGQQGYKPFPEGDYNFRVKKMERQIKSSPKLGEHNVAHLELTVYVDDTERTVFEDLHLHSSMEWKLTAFFRAIGAKEHGKKLKMDWTKVEGSKGRARFEINKYTGSDGKEHENNRVKSYIDFDESNFPVDFDFMKVEDGAEELPFD